MANKTAKLVVIYNHQYDSNIKKITALYEGRFERILHLMPFFRAYEGGVGSSKICPVYESSYCFQGYIAQAQTSIIENDVDYYIFLADDCLLNPNICEKNLSSYFELEDNDAFIRKIENLTPRKGAFFIHGINLCITGEKICKLDEYEDNDHFLYLSRAKNKLYNTREYKIEKYIPSERRIRVLYRKFGVSDTKYSKLLLGWSDLVIVPRLAIKSFCWYCGVLAAANVHVELAIPTALVWSMVGNGKIRNEIDLNKKGKYGKQNHANTMIKNMSDIDNIFSKEKMLYVHPIKLSGCKIGGSE